MSPVTAAGLQARQASCEGGGRRRMTVQGESSENTGESFYQSVIPVSAAGFMPADGLGFFADINI